MKKILLGLFSLSALFASSQSEGLSFDGADDQVNIPISSGILLSNADGFTIEMIINPDVPPVLSKEYHLLSFMKNDDISSRISLVSNNDSEYQARLVAFGGNTTLKAGECSHIAFVGNGAGSNGFSPVQFYLNAKLIFQNDPWDSCLLLNVDNQKKT